MFVENLDDTAEEKIGMMAEDIIEEVKKLKENYVLVPVDDPGMRMVDTEIEIK